MHGLTCDSDADARWIAFQVCLPNVDGGAIRDDRRLAGHASGDYICFKSLAWGVVAAHDNVIRESHQSEGTYADDAAGKKAGMLNAVKNCLTWYSGYLARICCSTAFASPL